MVLKEGLAPLLDTPIKRGIEGEAPVGWAGWEERDLN